MKDLGERMRAISEDPPPSTIDVDKVIAGEQRRARNLRAVAAGFAVVAALASTALIPGLRADLVPGLGNGIGADRPDPTVATTGPEPAVAETSPGGPGATSERLPCGVLSSPSLGTYQSFDPVRPEPTQRPEVIATRLSTSLTNTLTKTLSLFNAAARVPGCDKIEFSYEPTRRSYRVDLEITDSLGTSSLGITVGLTPRDDTRCMDKIRCSIMPFKDGSSYSEENTDSGAGGMRYGVILNRSDGTQVTLEHSTGNYGQKPTRPNVLLTIDDLVGIGAATGLTLY